MRRATACAALIGLLLLSPASTEAMVPGHQADSIVGLWGQVHRCQQLVDALDARGLGALAPGMVGDYFPDQTFEELAAKPDLCSGAKPQRHYHFFTSNGQFGSLDQHYNQVDDGTWEKVDSNTFRIGASDRSAATFDFSMRGDTLTLIPRITEAQRREALADPKAFSTAGWMVAVSYPGTKWEGLPCVWC
jgi:hypothetical protein